MNGLSRSLGELADAAARASEDVPAGDVLTHARRRRRMRRTLPAVAGVAALAAGVVLVPPAIQRWRDDAGPAAPDACGADVSSAASEAYGGADVHGPSDGPVGVTVGTDATVEAGADLAVGVGVAYAASGVDALDLVPGSDGSFVSLWLVDGDRVVGVAVPVLTGDHETTVTPSREVWIDGAYELRACGEGGGLGGAAPPGEYRLVGAVAARAGVASDGQAAVVLSESVPVRVGESDPLAGLGACGSAWPADVETATDGYALGLRLSGPADLGVVEPGDPGTGDPAGLSFPVTVRNASDAPLVGWTGHPWLVVVRDGVVVGVTGASDDVGIDASLAPGAEARYDAWAPLHDCATVGTGEHADTGGGDPLPPGGYEVYAMMSFFFAEPPGDEGPEGDRTDVTAVGGPWPVVVP